MNDNQLKETLVSSESIFSGRILNVERWQVTCANGAPATREIVVHRGAAAVVPVFEDGTTLLVRQHRIACDRVTLEIPAGKLDHVGEDPLDCAVRELEEETGLKAARMTLLTSLLTTPGFCTEKIGIYLAEGLTQGDTHPDEDEFLEVERMPLAQLVDLVLDNQIPDAKTQTAALKAWLLLNRKDEE